MAFPKVSMWSLTAKSAFQNNSKTVPNDSSKGFEPMWNRSRTDFEQIVEGSSRPIPKRYQDNSNQGKFLRVRKGCQASQRKGGPPGKSGKLPGKSGELPGKSGKLPGNPWIAVKFHRERTSGEVAEKLPWKLGELPGKLGELPRSSGELDPLPATRQICLQSKTIP